jgi:DNA-directed RNA polymerase specialized sigma24 family protein
MFTTSLAVLAVLLFLPIVLLLWVTESRTQRIHRLRNRHGWTQQRIADHMKISRSTVRRHLALA